MSKYKELQNLWDNSNGDVSTFVEEAIKKLPEAEYSEDDLIFFLVDAPAKLVDIVEALVKFGNEQQDCIRQVKELATEF